MLQFNHVTICYGERPVVEDFSLAVDTGQIVTWLNCSMVSPVKWVRVAVGLGTMIPLQDKKRPLGVRRGCLGEGCRSPSVNRSNGRGEIPGPSRLFVGENAL